MSPFRLRTADSFTPTCTVKGTDAWSWLTGAGSTRSLGPSRRRYSKRPDFVSWPSISGDTAVRKVDRIRRPLTIRRKMTCWPPSATCERTERRQSRWLGRASEATPPATRLVKLSRARSIELSVTAVMLGLPQFGSLCAAGSSSRGRDEPHLKTQSFHRRGSSPARLSARFIIQALRPSGDRKLELQETWPRVVRRHGRSLRSLALRQTNSCSSRPVRPGPYR